MGENLGLIAGVYCGGDMGTIDRQHVRVLWGTFLKLGCNLKTAHRRMKRMKIWVTNGHIICMNIGTFDLKRVKAFWGHSVHFSQHWSVTQKWLS